MEPKIQTTTHESQSSSSAAAQVVASVDLLIEIFLRLPVKTLIRFKSVSKHWQSLISDPGFTILRNPNPNPATGLIIQVPTRSQRPYIVSLDSSSPRIRTLKLINPWPYDTTTIMSSSNGLILMCGSYKKHGSVFRHYYVCNPTTNKYFKLPQIQHRMLLLPMCLASFDPSKSPHYKVVCALRSLEHKGLWYQFMVYSSETGCWRKSCVEPFQIGSVDFERGVYWNGAMHWVSLTGTGKSIYFDPDDDQMSQEIMPTPPNINKNQYYYFGESCGHLHYAGHFGNRLVLDVYELKKDYSEWFVKFSIVSCHQPYLSVVVRGMSNADSFSVFLEDGKFVRYNCLNKTRETICEVRGTPLEQCYLNLQLQHAESLCSV